MQKNIFKNSITLFFLFAFLLLRIVNVHAFSHFVDEDGQDDRLNCELCKIITTSHKLTPFTGGTSTDSLQNMVLDYPEYQTNYYYQTSQFSITLPKSVYNKPPPSTLG
ncbi:hypothetical protein NBT05_09205 [Aquimarina sp. ERC-38]|uniref:hypothetical protein n=1 Tax=Aquimarina sp. ERC-38 TaxID=2949996 RepID=UPI002245FBFA|nr:hypothetical protein [Aquimarina sp. ERC-38]UZO79148.1 hypothetical protein NBT05_09205 [Aquimarina sp. ERC-38]